MYRSIFDSVWLKRAHFRVDGNVLQVVINEFVHGLTQNICSDFQAEWHAFRFGPTNWWASCLLWILWCPSTMNIEANYSSVLRQTLSGRLWACFWCGVPTNKLTTFRDAQASLGYSDRCLHCDGCLSTSVDRDAQQWRHRLTSQFLDNPSMIYALFLFPDDYHQLFLVV